MKDAVKNTVAAGLKCIGKTGDDLTKCQKAAKWAGKDCTKEKDAAKTECEAAKANAKYLVATALTAASMVALM